jgi:hypothetical protein
MSIRIGKNTFIAGKVNVETLLDSPMFSGTPSAPTPELDDNTKQIANTEFVQMVVENKLENIEALPGQEGNENKVLVTNGSEASWQYTSVYKDLDKETEIGSNQFVVNTLSKETYNAMKEAGTLSDTELYMVNDETPVPTKVSELENDLGYLTNHQDISGKADTSYVNTELNKKAEKATTLEGYGIEDITNMNTTSVVDNNGEIVSKVTINNNEVVLTSTNLTKNVQGGTYVNISKPLGETLYKFGCHPMIVANMGAVLCNDVYTTTTDFDYEGIDINRLNELESVDAPVSELYAYKLPTNLVSYLVPCYQEDKTPTTLRASLTDDIYQLLGAPDLSDESKDMLLNTLTGGSVDPTTPIYFIRLEGVPNDDGSTGGLLPVYTDVNGDYIVGIMAIWSMVSLGEISVGGGGDTLIIDWNEAAIKKFEEIDALPQQQSNEGKFLTTDGTTASWNKVYAGVIRVWE